MDNQSTIVNSDILCVSYPVKIPADSEGVLKTKLQFGDQPSTMENVLSPAKPEILVAKPGNNVDG